MGIISDTFEDNAERAGLIFDSNEPRYSNDPITLKPVRVEKCPLCFQPFPYSNLNEHIRDSHRTEYCYVRLNGTIVREVGWADNGISSIEIGLLGYKEVEVCVDYGNFRETFTGASENLDVSSSVPADFEGELVVKIEPKTGVNRTFSIFCKSIPEFRRSDLDGFILELQSDLDAATRSLDLGKWRLRFKKFAGVTALEERYFNGFYEYALASYLEKNEKRREAKQHFEDAFGLLLPFGTRLAQTALRIMGLKMNCFAFLEGCSRNSPFAPAEAFFIGRKNPSAISFTRAEPSNLGVFIDSFSQLLLDTLFCFYKDPDVAMPTLISELQREPLSRETNNTAKLHLLKARYFKYVGQTDEAADAYSSLQYDPTFGAESRSFIECCAKKQ